MKRYRSGMAGAEWQDKARALCDAGLGCRFDEWAAIETRLLSLLCQRGAKRAERFPFVADLLRGAPMHGLFCRRALDVALEAPGGKKGGTRLARWAIAQCGLEYAREVLADCYLAEGVAGCPVEYLEWLLSLGPAIDVHGGEGAVLRDAAENNDLGRVEKLLALPGGREVGRHREDPHTLGHVGDLCSLGMLRTMWGLYPAEYLEGDEFRYARARRAIRELEAACFAGARERAAHFRSELDGCGLALLPVRGDHFRVLQNATTRAAAECVLRFMPPRVPSLQGHLAGLLRWSEAREAWAGAVLRSRRPGP